MKNLLLASLIGLSAQTTFALGLDLGISLGGDIVVSDYIRIGGWITGGSGCPNGDVQPTQTERGIELVYSDKMQAGLDSSKRIERVTCMLRAPIQVPEGFRLVATVRTEGFAWVDHDQVIVEQELFLAGQNERVSEKNLQTGDFVIKTQHDQVVSASCGQDVNLALNLSATILKKSTSLNDSFIAFDRTVVKARLERCD